MILPDYSLMPRVEELIDKLGWVKFIIMLDLDERY